jgi:DNA topoisomerase-2
MGPKKVSIIASEKKVTKTVKATKATNSDIFIKSNNQTSDNLSETSQTAVTIEQKYQKKTQIEHILLRPDTYVGDISLQNESMWVYDNSSNKIVKKDITYVPGLYKIFDEILVNARDHSCNDPTCDTIKVVIDKESNRISVWNNGKGIDVVEHSEHKMYIPEMLFGELLTSSNYDDTQQRTTGGRNGYGAKLTNVFSTFFSIETVDGPRKLKFYQEFSNNLSSRTKPKITELKSEKPLSYTKIEFIPDLVKFKLTSLTDDIVSLMAKRVYDIAGVSNKVKVYLNDKKIDVNNFKKYIEMYQLTQDETVFDNLNEDDNDDNDEEDSEGSKSKSKDVLIMEESDRWRVGVKYIPDGNFEQISFVNGICTYHGGNHVDYIMNQIIKKLEAIIQKKYKEAKVKPASIKENLVIFIDSVINNPAFTSQTKETLKTKSSEFGSVFEPSEKFIKKLGSTGIVEQIISMAKMKEESFLKKTDGKKVTSIKGIPKLEDANWAGDKKKSILCKLILTEGDSAKALAMAGLSVVGSDKYGVFPLKGKLLNVRDASPKQLLENEEIINIKKIIGLQHNKDYTDLNDLRYGGIIVMTDQDYDGFHIKGLLMNFFHYFWPSLMKNHNFISSLATPIVKATKGKDIKIFYNLTDYEKWKNKPGSNLYIIKYYKGLGTSTKDEGKEYFKDIDNKLINYSWKSGCYQGLELERELEQNLEQTDKPTPTGAAVGTGDALETVNESDSEDDSSNNSDVNVGEVKPKAKAKSKAKAKGKAKSSPKSINESENDFRDIIYKKIVKNNPKCFGVTCRYQDVCTESITLAFDKKRSNCRKIWLRNYDKQRILSNDQKDVPIPDFIHKELIHFSNDDINRSIPSVIDGFKPSTRKILYGTILRKLNGPKDEIKVAQLSGFISDKTGYHHGEASLNGAIVGMAQNFVGSNNINLLFPSGQFGSRILGGKDFASPRYTFTYLAELTRLIFRADDDPILNYLDDDGTIVEPEWYCPIIPMVLVNGADGIGTGFSTKIPQYNPLDIIYNLRALIDKTEPKEMRPWYRGFTGTVEKDGDRENEYIIKGKYSRLDSDTIQITELPIGVWTTPYKEFLEKKTEKTKNQNQMIDSFKTHYTDDAVNFILKMDEYTIDKMEKNDTLLNKLKLTKPVKLSNMHLYSSSGNIKKYSNVMEIISDFYEVRMMMYSKRKEYLIGKLGKELDILKYKKLFIEMVLDNKILIYKQKKSDIIDKLIEFKFPKLQNDSYDYLTDMPLFNLTYEKIEELNEKVRNKEEELLKVQSTSETDQWKMELDEFEREYSKWYNKYTNGNLSEKASDVKSKAKAQAKPQAKPQAKAKVKAIKS